MEFIFDGYPLNKISIMRFIYFLFFCLFNLSAFAQEETKTHHQETGFFEEEKMVSAYDLVFQTYEETESLFKISGLNALFNREQLDFYEQI